MPGFLIDLDGTLYAGNRPIEHAAEFIAYLRSSGLPYLYVTNNSSRTPEAVAAHIAKAAGIPAHADEVFTSAEAAARYIRNRKAGSRVWPVGEEGLLRALSDAGLNVSDATPDFVVQGIDRDLTYAKLEKAVRLIREGASYILTNPDLLLPGESGFSPGAGAIGASIQAAAQAEPVIIGKPSPIMMQYAVERLGMPTSDIWVVGDNLRTDIGGGKAAGCRTALVLTGLATKENVQSQIEMTNTTPDLICNHLMPYPSCDAIPGLRFFARGVESVAPINFFPYNRNR
jgi:4-nitrophenyl phosphatase